MNIEYGSVNGTPLLLDIYVPDNPTVTPMPAIIWIHGGSWESGDKFPSEVRALAQRGFLGVSINYRLSGEAAFPAAVEDCKSAVRWLRANAEKYNIDPDRIGLWGESAGGHLAMMVGCADETAGLEGNGDWAEFSSRVQAVCSYYGVSDLAKQYEYYKEIFATDNGPVIQFMGGTPEERPDTYTLASPINHVTSDDPPLLLVHGDLDTTVPLTQSRTMHQAFQQAGLDSALTMVTGAGHGFNKGRMSPSPAQIQQKVIDFFTKHLVEGE